MRKVYYYATKKNYKIQLSKVFGSSLVGIGSYHLGGLTATADGEMGPYPLGTGPTADGEMGPYPLSMGPTSDGEMGPYPLSGGPTTDGEMGPYPLGTSDGEMGPYPLSDHTNLLGPTSYQLTSSSRGYGGGGGGGIGGSGSGRGNSGRSGGSQSSYRTNYGTTAACSPMPTRRHDPNNDSIRRHSAHGRIACTSGIFTKKW